MMHCPLVQGSVPTHATRMLSTMGDPPILKHALRGEGAMYDANPAFCLPPAYLPYGTSTELPRSTELVNKTCRIISQSGNSHLGATAFETTLWTHLSWTRPGLLVLCLALLSGALLCPGFGWASAFGLASLRWLGCFATWGFVMHSMHLLACFAPAGVPGLAQGLRVCMGPAA